MSSVFASVSIGALFHIIAIAFNIARFKEWKRVHFSGSFKLFLTLCLWAVISSAINALIAKEPSILFKTKYLIGGVLATPFFVFFLRKSSLKTKNNLIIWLIITLAIALLGSVAKLLFWQDLPLFKLHKFRAGGITGVIKFGYASALVASVAFGYFLNRAQEKKKKYFSLLFFCLCSFAILFSQTRGAALGLGISCVFSLIWWKPKLKLPLVSLIIVAGGLFLALSPYFSKTKFRFLLPLSTTSNMIRISLLKTSLHIIKDKPILGLGTDQFINKHQKYKKKHNIEYSHIYAVSSHNTFIEPFMNWGIPGGMLFLLWFLLWGYEAWRVPELKAIYGPFLITVGISGCFDVLQSGVLYFLLLGVYSLFIAQLSLKKIEEEKENA